jgi:prepilin-type N-terminal cleavage/methylation domain-containing protein
MGSLSTSKHANGFTLIEVLISTAIFTLLIGLALFMSMDTYRGYDSRSGRDVLVSILDKARSRALQNEYASPHGVCYDAAAGSYIFFRGSGYVRGTATNEALPAGSSVPTSTPPLFACEEGRGVVFAQLSGTTTPVEIVLKQGGRIATTTLNYEGRIDW